MNGIDVIKVAVGFFGGVLVMMIAVDCSHPDWRNTEAYKEEIRELKSEVSDATKPKQPRFYHTQYEGLHYDLAVDDKYVQLDVAGQGELMELLWNGTTLVYRHRSVPLLFYPITELRLALPPYGNECATVTNLIFIK